MKVYHVRSSTEWSARGLWDCDLHREAAIEVVHEGRRTEASSLDAQRCQTIAVRPPGAAHVGDDGADVELDLVGMGPALPCSASMQCGPAQPSSLPAALTQALFASLSPAAARGLRGPGVSQPDSQRRRTAPTPAHTLAGGREW